ncbi:beta-glucosidase family protein [Arthrobacter sp. Soil761]|uniref:beta-glucosidase family protein n=1 Tax=Arthrobacter sp. Soil761 TaxID=1736400 RepID=UPI0006F63D2F|nr:glycoside hydrolase family 3 C-terminal domain-containing protein [Arthrobacter sp. Soil761]
MALAPETAANLVQEIFELQRAVRCTAASASRGDGMGTALQFVLRLVSIPGVPRLGVLELRLVDGPAGVRLPQPTTALPVPVALASAFDAELARRYGQVIAREGKALGQDVSLSPMVNTIRVPQGGRNYETFSEDPLVTAKTAAAEIEGIAGEDMIPTVKHFALNNQENNRSEVSVTIDDQALHEVELPGFAAAVDAGAGSVMCAYNKVNAEHSCGNNALLNDILKTQLGFQGWVMSDWGAAHAPTDLTAGLDQEMHWIGRQQSFFGAPLDAALANGTVPLAALDDAVARILGQMERYGFLHGERIRPELDLAAGAAVAQKVAEEGAVLLKNEDAALPLTSATTSIALIGPTAKHPKIGGGGSAAVIPAFAASPLDAISSRADAGTKVSWTSGIPESGTPIPTDALSPASLLDSTGTAPLAQGKNVSYTGKLTVPADGTYSFVLDAPLGYATLRIDETSIAASIQEPATGSIRLTKGGHSVSFRGLALSATPTTMNLTWITPADGAAARAKAVEQAKTVHTPVVFAYDNATATADRDSLSLPADQDLLISEVATANPRTVVVLNTGSAITMPWISKVSAVLNMYYPGQNGAEATARLLYGDINPSGKLTQTFPASDTATPIAGNPSNYPGVENVVTYSEGIHAGYKWYNKTGATPLFPFGHGLSYTTFDYHGVSAKQENDTLTVRLTLKNTGKRAGKEIVQVYAGPSAELAVPQVERKLVGYQKVDLKPGENQRVEITIPLKEFSSWNTATQTWELGTGNRQIFVGSSSANLPLTFTTNISEMRGAAG